MLSFEFLDHGSFFKIVKKLFLTFCRNFHCTAKHKIEKISYFIEK